MKEYEVKKILIDYILAEKSCDLILGSEFRFDFGARRADIVAINSDMAIAYEIKTANDSVSRLSWQLRGYKKYFDYCYVVCESENLSLIRKHILSGVGIMLIKEGEIKKIKESNRFKKHDKVMLSSTLSMDELRRETDAKQRAKHELCFTLSKIKKTDDIRKLSRESAIKKMKESFETFIREKGETLNRDDITTLNRISSSKLFTHA